MGFTKFISAPLKNRSRRMLVASGLDRPLSLLLRTGILPRAFERFAPQYTDYNAPTIRRVRRDGIVADLDLSDLPDWKASFRRRDKKRERMYSLIPAGSKVLEVGCARGWVALKIARAVGPTGLVLAVDAHRPSVDIAASRFDANHFFWAKAACTLFSDRPGTISLAAEASRNSASMSVSTSNSGTRMEAVTLDAWLRSSGYPDPDVVKVSVNGWEAHVLRGGVEFLKRRRPLLFTEVGDANLRRAGSTPAELLSLLRNLGYYLETTWGNTRIPDGDALNGCLFDVVAFPSSPGS